MWRELQVFITSLTEKVLCNHKEYSQSWVILQRASIQLLFVIKSLMLLHDLAVKDEVDGELQVMIAA